MTALGWCSLIVQAGALAILVQIACTIGRRGCDVVGAIAVCVGMMLIAAALAYFEVATNAAS